MSTASFAIRGFCPNVLALKAVLMILDLPDFSDEWQIANALTDTGLIPICRLLVSNSSLHTGALIEAYFESLARSARSANAHLSRKKRGEDGAPSFCDCV